MTGTVPEATFATIGRDAGRHASRRTFASLAFWISLASGLAAAWLVADTVSIVCSSHGPNPYNDGWGKISRFTALFGSDPLRAFEQQNEHWIVVPLLIMFIDIGVDQGRGYFELVMTLSFQGMHALLLSSLLGRPTLSGGTGLLIPALIFALLFGMHLFEILGWGFEICFASCFLSATAAFVLFGAELSRPSGERASPQRRIGIGLLATISAFSLANGVIVGPCCLVVAALRGRWNSMAFAAVLTVLVGAAFFARFVPPPPGSYAGSPAISTYLVNSLRYFTALLGDLVPDDARVAQWLGCWGLLLTAGAVVVVVLDRPGHRQRTTALLILIFTIGAAAAVTLGRPQIRISGTLSSRYTLATSLFWSAQLIFWSTYGPRLRVPWRAFAASATVLVLIVAVFGVHVVSRSKMDPGPAREEADMLLAGLSGPTMAIYQTVAPDEVAGMLAYARDRRLAVFAGPQTQELGQPISSWADRGPCAGRTTSLDEKGDLDPAGVAVQGTWRTKKGAGGFGRVVIGDAAGTIVGFGSLAPNHTWHAFASGRAASLKAYGVDAIGTRCELDGP